MSRVPGVTIIEAKQGGAEVVASAPSPREEPARDQVLVYPGAQIFPSITAALESITDASADKIYDVLVGPGNYAERITFKPYINVEGAGRGVTNITSPPTTAPAGGASGARCGRSRLRGDARQGVGPQFY